jgi:aspartate aminotransferase
MELELSARVRALAPSRTIAMNRLAQDLIAQGQDIVDLTVGEPDFDTPAPIRDAAKAAIDAGFTRYTDVSGYEELRAAISRKLRRENGLEYPEDSILVSSGAKHSLTNAIFALVDPGDEVLVPIPYWVSYSEEVKLAGGRVVALPTAREKGFKLDPERLEAAITTRTKALILCSPCNPSGAVYSRPELEALAQVLERHPRVWVVSDEVYEHIEYGAGHASPAAIPSLAERCALVNGVSKAYAMTGWRIGYLAGPRGLAKACAKLQGQMTSASSSVSQRAAIAALDSDPAIVASMVAEFRARRDLSVEALSRIEGLSLLCPEGAFYLFPDVSRLPVWKAAPEGERSDAVSRHLLESARVATVPGSAFGDDSSIRLSFASSEERLREAYSRIASLLGSRN